MAYEPTQWRSGDTITSERLNKMEQGIAGSGSGEFYALHTTQTQTSDENESITITYSRVELREDGLPILLIIDNVIDGGDNTTWAVTYSLMSYNDEKFYYNDYISVNRSTGEVIRENTPPGGGTEDN